ncbi:MAG: hypothetical protein F4139_03845 [Gemmatimonadetes bacterium]|nr:hypothetical protein [Gemmatimonadota bacterium]MYH52068.1 hypothetical protein [Gemmatimonadota bacterium]MYK67383.1 hypothetical protein [Gemmatimonadota bacterium]
MYFSEDDSAYVMSNVVARLGGLGDDRIMLGSIVDIEKIPSGWAVLDGINRQVVFLDDDLNPMRTVGGPGDGPGEFQAPGQLATVGDTIAVLEMGSGGRMTYLGPQGDFLRVSGHVGHPVMSVAIHPDLGRFFPILSREHYLVRDTEKEGSRRIARIPAAFVPEIEGSAGLAGMTPNLVAVTADGAAHVLDGEHLALVSFNPDEDHAGLIALLPREMRDRKLRERSEAGSTLGGHEVLTTQTVMRLDALADGRLFASVRYGTSRGYVLNPASLTATSIDLALVDWPDEWQVWSFVLYFDGKNLILAGGITPELVLATTELVPRTHLAPVERYKRLGNR